MAVYVVLTHAHTADMVTEGVIKEVTDSVIEDEVAVGVFKHDEFEVIVTDTC